MKRIFIFTAISFFFLTASFSQVQYKSKYPDIPIVDVHVHASDIALVINYLKVSDVIKQQYGSNLAYFVGLNALNAPLAEMKDASKNRFLFAVGGIRTHKGFIDVSNEIIEKVHNGGFVGVKFWFGDPSRRLQPGESGITRIDDPRFAPFFSNLEKANILMTSLHIADPNGPFHDRQKWMIDPVFYWEQIRAFENIVAKYPRLTIVAAHMAWIICQDAQIDYLRYMLSTYPNLYLDVSASLNSYMTLVNYDNLRSFYIEYQDRILYGSDFHSFTEEGIRSTANQFANNFIILETDQMVGNVKGLNLPREVLEKIYYKNAIKLYPGLKEIMGVK